MERDWARLAEHPELEFSAELVLNTTNITIESIVYCWDKTPLCELVSIQSNSLLDFAEIVWHRCASLGSTELTNKMLNNSSGCNNEEGIWCYKEISSYFCFSNGNKSVILVSVATIQFIKLYYQFDSSTPAHTNISKTEE